MLGTKITLELNDNHIILSCEIVNLFVSKGQLYITVKDSSGNRDFLAKDVTKVVPLAV